MKTVSCCLVNVSSLTSYNSYEAPCSNHVSDTGIPGAMAGFQCDCGNL